MRTYLPDAADRSRNRNSNKMHNQPDTSPCASHQQISRTSWSAPSSRPSQKCRTSSVTSSSFPVRMLRHPFHPTVHMPSVACATWPLLSHSCVVLERASDPQYHPHSDSAIVDSTAFTSERTHATLPDFITTSQPISPFFIWVLSDLCSPQCSLSNAGISHRTTAKTSCCSYRHGPRWSCTPCCGPHSCNTPAQRRIWWRDCQGTSIACD